MKKIKHGFTLIELLVVILIIIILISIVIPKFSGLKEKAIRASCAKNAKNLSQAILVYTSLSSGYLTGLSKNDPAGKIYGVLFEKNGWNNLNNLVCPSSEDKKPPQPAGFGKPLNLVQGTTIDYWIVFTGNVPNDSDASKSHHNELNTITYPGRHVLILESFEGDSGWTDVDRHGNVGIIARLDGSVDYVTELPENSGTQITKSECAT